MIGTGRILLVDDKGINLSILEEMLLGRYELGCATSGEECLELAPTFLPDLVLLDVMMPGIDGYETCKRLRANERLRHTKIIMVSAKASLPERLAGYEAGADDYVTKPFEEQELLSKMKVFLRLKTIEESNEAMQRLNAELQRANQALSLAKSAAESALHDLESSNEQLEAEVLRRVAAEERLRHDALHDVLTNLPNRALLADRIDRCIHRMHRESGYKFAILFLDLDDFKVINDSLGHRLGDRLLIEIGDRLVSSIRSTDCASVLHDGTTARVGGDEFVVLLDGIETQSSAVFVADRLRRALAQPFKSNDIEMRPTASVGVAVSKAEYEDADEILRDADTALYRAKELGKNQIALFDASMHQRAVARLRMKSDLVKALDRKQLFVHYQPIVSLASGEIRALEALARWNHPEQGLIPPNEFIPVAEETGLIAELGRWVLHEACQELVAWRTQFPENELLSVSVNISGKQLSAPEVVEEIQTVLDETGLAAEHLNLELTETVLMKSTSAGADNLAELKSRKLGLHLDDFGTGYSSLSNLASLPITALKLDRSFVHEMAHSGAGAATIKAVLEMAHARGLRVIAEGVENQEQAASLQSMGCDFAQGYHFSRPVGTEVVERMLRADASRRASA